MTQIEKLYAHLLQSRSAMRFADFARILSAFGFTLDRVRGSHRIFRHPHVPRPLSIQPRRGEAKPYQIEQFLDMVEAHGLEMKK